MMVQTRWLIGTLVVSAVALGPPAATAQDAARHDGWVVLALDDYRALRARAFPSTPDPLPTHRDR